jgi:GrpB-like predicted nucleotidyltransferase (UPF0157 family)
MTVWPNAASNPAWRRGLQSLRPAGRKPEQHERLSLREGAELGSLAISAMNRTLQLLIVGKEWASRFAEERSRIAHALGDSALDIQHVGSTAIPGITAKPILDIAVAIHDFESGHALVPFLVALGYTYRGENGIPRRHYFERDDAYHLHVFEQGSLDWRRHLHFRDRLLASSELARRYSQTKFDAAQEADGDRERYQSLKSVFIAEVQSS